MQTVWDDPLAFMVGRDHPLAGRDTVTLNELLDHPAVLPATTTYTRAILERAVQAAGAALKVGMATNYLETLHMLVATGLGWSLLPATLLDDQVVELPVEGLSLRRQLGAVTHRRRTLSNAGRQMIDVCGSAV